MEMDASLLPSLSFFGLILFLSLKLNPHAHAVVRGTCTYSGADKFLARPGRKEANVSVSMG